jgi:predicted O-methyltransferase YrrM
MRQKSPGDAPMLRWDSEAPNRLTVGDTTFNVADLFPARNDQRMVVRKPPDMIEVVAAVINDVKPRNIIELGIALGGSTALLAQLAQPAKLVAIEKELAAVAALESYISSHDLESIVKPYYGVDQADTAALDRILASEFGDEPLDLVIDDASHLLNETRISFNRLFPRVREAAST